MGNRIAPAGGIRISFALLAFALVASLVQVVSIAPAQAVAGDTGPAPIPSASTTTLDGRQWETKNQHRIWWNSGDGRWDAILPTTTGWKIAKGAIPATPGAAPAYGATVSNDPSDRPDIYWDDANSRLYVLMSGGATTLYTFNYAGGVYTLNTTSSLPAMEPDEGRAAIYKVPGGNVWASMMSGDGLFVARSIDDGVTWEGPVKLHDSVAEGQTQLAHFGTQIGVAAAEDGDDSVVSKYLFYRLTENDNTWDAVVNATGTLTLAVQPTNFDTVRIGAKTYTFRPAAGMPQTNGNVAIGASVAVTRSNLVSAVNLGAGAGTAYGSETVGNPQATMGGFAGGTTATVTARESGGGGNLVVLQSSNPANPVSGPMLAGGLSSWTYEQMPLSSPSGLTHSDDELSLIRNTNDDLYVATETQRIDIGSTTEKRQDPQVVVFRRVASSGAWDQHVVKKDDSTSTTDRKRPVVAILDSTLYVIAIAQIQTESSYKTAPLNTMAFSGGNAFDSSWVRLFNTRFEEFRNNIVPREPTTSATKLPVLLDWAWDAAAEDVAHPQDTTIWQTSLPNSGNQTPGVFAGLDKIVDRSSPTSLGGVVSDLDALTTDNPIATPWTKVSGPGTVTFSNAASPTSTATFSANGIYVLRLTATEAPPNALSNFDQVTVNVVAVNNPPTLSVAEPDNGDTVAAGALITFQATANDPEKGNISGDITWTSSRDGSIGIGGFFQRTLSTGVHTIRARINDGQNTVLSPNITLTVGTATPPPPDPNSPFIDISGHTFEVAIKWLAAKGITSGCNPPANTRFCPDANVTRGQMAAFLVRALNLPAYNGPDRFTDDNNSVFESNIERLAQAEITVGCNPPANTRFCPDANVTRGQMAAFLVRAFDLPAYNGPDRFTDDNNSVFESNIERLAQAGVTLGCNPPANTRFCPDANVTRGQMAAFLKRAFGE